MAHAHPMSKSLQSRTGGPVQASIVRTSEELEKSARILSKGLNDRRIRLSFQCETEAGPDRQGLEVTFASELTSKPLLCALASKSLSSEYCLEAELSSEVAGNWKRLTAIDPVPSCLMFRPVASGV